MASTVLPIGKCDGVRVRPAEDATSAAISLDTCTTTIRRLLWLVSRFCSCTSISIYSSATSSWPPLFTFSVAFCCSFRFIACKLIMFRFFVYCVREVLLFGIRSRQNTLAGSPLLANFRLRSFWARLAFRKPLENLRCYIYDHHSLVLALLLMSLSESLMSTIGSRPDIRNLQIRYEDRMWCDFTG